MTYLNGFADEILKDRMNVFGAVDIVRPKGYRKTTTVKHFPRE